MIIKNLNESKKTTTSVEGRYEHVGGQSVR